MTPELRTSVLMLRTAITREAAALHGEAIAAHPAVQAMVQMAADLLARGLAADDRGVLRGGFETREQLLALAPAFAGEALCEPLSSKAIPVDPGGRGSK